MTAKLDKGWIKNQRATYFGRGYKFQTALNDELVAELKKVNTERAYDTGRMANSWQVTGQSRAHASLIENTAKNEYGHHYAGYVEYGTVKMAPRHILTDVLANFNVLVKRTLEKMKGQK